MIKNYGEFGIIQKYFSLFDILLFYDEYRGKGGMKYGRKFCTADAEKPLWESLVPARESLYSGDK